MTIRPTLRPARVAASLGLCAAIVLAVATPAAGQISLTSAVDLALRNSPRVKTAEAEVSKARAALEESKDVYVPTITAGAGLDQAYGYSPYPPTLFNLNSTSLVYNASQFSYIHSSRAGLDAAQQSLQDMRETVAEDAALTFIALDHDQQREAVLGQQSAYAAKLLAIVQDRFDAGQDTRMSLTEAKLSVARLRFATLRAQDDTVNDRNHLARLMGVPLAPLRAEGGFPAAPISPGNFASTEGYANASVASAFQNAKAKQLQAQGDAHFLYRPQISFVAQYNRYATFTDSFANLKKLYTNITADDGVFGVSISIPILDRVRRAKAVESAADATHALHDAEFAQMSVLDAQDRLGHTVEVLKAQAEIAALEQQLAQQQLEIIQAQLANANSGAPPMTPKDEQNARIAEREKYLSVIDTAFNLQQAEISLLRQTGHLEDWLLHAGAAPAAAPAPPAPSTLQPHP